MNRVYFVISEDVRLDYGSYLEPPEDGPIVAIVVAASAHKARWLAWRAESCSRSLTAAEMPNFRCHRLGFVDGPPAVLKDAEAKPWWNRVTNEMRGPAPRGESKKLLTEGQRRDVAILGGDPSL